MKTRLKGQLGMAVEYHGRLYPAWMELHSSRVWCLAGSVGFGAHVLITHDWRARDRNYAATLRQRLKKTGYRLVTLKARPRLKFTPPDPTPPTPSTATESPRSTPPPDTSPRRSRRPRRSDPAIPSAPAV